MQSKVMESARADKIPGKHLKADKNLDSLVANEVQILLAEKRTSLSLLRTAIAVLILPMTVFSFLVATSRFYNIFDTLIIYIPLVVLNVVLTGIGFHLVIRAITRIRHHDHSLAQLKETHSELGRLVD